MQNDTDALKNSIERLERAEKKLSDFRETFYMPWEGEEPMTVSERAARDRLRELGLALKQEVVDAQKELVSVAKVITKQ